ADAISAIAPPLALAELALKVELLMEVRLAPVPPLASIATAPPLTALLLEKVQLFSPPMWLASAETAPPLPLAVFEVNVESLVTPADAPDKSAMAPPLTVAALPSNRQLWTAVKVPPLSTSTAPPLEKTTPFRRVTPSKVRSD